MNDTDSSGRAASAEVARSACKTEDCSKEAVVRGLCRAHYWQERRARLGAITCTVADCDRPQFCKGLCRGHYARERKGKPVDGPLAAQHDGNATLSCRVSKDVLLQLHKQAVHLGTSPARLATRFILEGLGLAE